MKTIFHTIIIVLLICSNSYGQKYEMGKVSIKELQEKAHSSDTSAVAAVLYKKGKTVFEYSEKDGFTISTNLEMRVKIYKKEGLSFANYEIPYYVGYENMNQDRVKLLEATTYNLVNGKIEKTKLNGEGSFKERASKNWKVLTVTLPNATVGSVVELKYSIKSDNILFFLAFKFQESVPVNYAEYITETPVNYVYKRIIKGYVDVKSDSKAVSATRRYIDEYHNPHDIDYTELSSSHIAKDIPALKKEEYIDNIGNYLSSIEYELELIKMPDHPDKNLAQTWEGVTKTIYEDKRFGEQLNAKQYFEIDLATITKGLESREEKIDAILNYVKVKMNWNKQYGIYTDVGVKKAYLDRTGNAAEINFILISMLNASGIITYPVLVSTIQNGMTSFPNRTAFNYIVAAIEDGNSQILLDATGKYTAAGVIPEYALNWTGRLIREYGTSKEINMAPSVSSKNTVTLMSSIDKEGKISGKARIVKTDYEALDFREKYAGVNRESYLEKLENTYPGLVVKNYTLENEKNSVKPIQESFEFTSDNVTDSIGDKMYFYPLLFFTQLKNPFVQEGRKLPVFFGYPKQDKYTLNIDIPEGYMVESVPQPMAIATGEGVGSFKFNIQASANKIQIVVTSEINQMLVAPEFYPTLKDYFKKMTDKQSEKIILKKI